MAGGVDDAGAQSTVPSAAGPECATEAQDCDIRNELHLSSGWLIKLGVANLVCAGGGGSWQMELLGLVISGLLGTAHVGAGRAWRKTRVHEQILDNAVRCTVALPFVVSMYLLHILQR